MRIALYITIKWWYMKIPVSELGSMIVCLIWDLINRWKRCSFPALLEYISYFYSRKVKTETKVERGYDDWYDERKRCRRHAMKVIWSDSSDYLSIFTLCIKTSFCATLHGVKFEKLGNAAICRAHIGKRYVFTNLFVQ